MERDDLIASLTERLERLMSHVERNTESRLEQTEALATMRRDIADMKRDAARETENRHEALQKIGASLALLDRGVDDTRREVTGRHLTGVVMAPLDPGETDKLVGKWVRWFGRKLPTAAKIAIPFAGGGGLGAALHHLLGHGK